MALTQFPWEARKNHFFLGFGWDYTPCVSTIHSRVKTWFKDQGSLRSFSKGSFVAKWGLEINTLSFVPFYTAFSAKRLRDLKLAQWVRKENIAITNIDVAMELEHDHNAIARLRETGVDLSEKGDHPLDSILAFREHDIYQSRSSRVVPWETQLPGYNTDPTTWRYTFFAFPAFGLAGKTLDESI